MDNSSHDIEENSMDSGFSSDCVKIYKFHV